MRLKMAQLGWPSDGEPVAMLMASHAELERKLEQEQQDRKQADLDTTRALGERNDARQRAGRMEAWFRDYLGKLDWVYDTTCNCPDCEWVRGIKIALGEIEP